MNNTIDICAIFSQLDYLLDSEENDDESEQGKIKEVLREKIVNPLRINYFVRADKTMKLRSLLEKFPAAKSILTEEQG